MLSAEEVEAENFVLNIGHPRGGGSQWCNRLPTNKEYAYEARCFGTCGNGDNGGYVGGLGNAGVRGATDLYV